MNFLPQRVSAEPGPRVQRAISDKWDFHMYHSRCLFLQLPRFSKKQSECEELVWAKVENESNYSSIFFSFASSVYWFIGGGVGVTFTHMFALLLHIQVCLKLMKGSDTHVAHCDTSEGFLVTSGSALLELRVGDTVSLEMTKYNTIVSQSSTSHTFTGFLIFPTIWGIPSNSIYQSLVFGDSGRVKCFAFFFFSESTKNSIIKRLICGTTVLKITSMLLTCWALTKSTAVFKGPPYCFDFLLKIVARGIYILVFFLKKWNPIQFILISCFCICITWITTNRSDGITMN